MNGILKDEFDFGGIFDNLEQAKKQLEEVAIIYNQKRLHTSNHYLTPNEMLSFDSLVWQIKKKGINVNNRNNRTRFIF